LLYTWVPYPQYPLNGTDFKLPLLRITQTQSLPWSTIFFYLGIIILVLVLARLVARIFRFAYKHNQQVLKARIKYNRFLFKVSGFSTLGLILLIYFLRHIPSSYETFLFVADLSRQNTPMNFVTAIGTFLTAFHAGYKNNSQAAKDALSNGISPLIVTKVFREKTRVSIKNGLILGLGAFLVTNHIPSAFELSIASFEVMYFVYPYTFGRLIKHSHKTKPKSAQVVKSA